MKFGKQSLLDLPDAHYETILKKYVGFVIPALITQLLLRSDMIMKSSVEFVNLDP